MRRALLMALILGALVPVSAQHFSFEYWHAGKVVLSTGDTLKGSVKYDMMQDIVEFKGDNNDVVYTPRKAVYYQIYDELDHRYRDFYSLPFATETGYHVPTFFELLAEGQMTLLEKEALVQQDVSSNYYYEYSRTRIYLAYRYFFLKANGDIEEFMGKKEDLLDQMGRKSDEVAKYIREKHLHIEKQRDFVRVVSYYNSLFKSR